MKKQQEPKKKNKNNHVQVPLTDWQYFNLSDPKICVHFVQKILIKY